MWIGLLTILEPSNMMSCVIFENVIKMCEIETEPLCSVIILNYQGCGIIKECIMSVLNNDYKNVEIILVDNSSDDGSYEEAEKLLENFSEKKIIRNRANLGFTKGYNQGMEIAQGDYYLLLNNDTILEEHAIRNYIRFFIQNPRVGLAEGRIVNRLHSMEGYVSNPNIVSLFGILDHESGPVPGSSQFASVSRIYSPIGVWPMFKKEVYKSIGGYDEDYWLVEEIRDLSARVWLSGLEVGYVYDAIVYHIGRLTLVKATYGDNIALSGLFHATKNSLMFAIKNYELNTLIVICIPYLFVKIIDVIESLRYGRRFFLIKLKAYLWVFQNLPKLLLKRKEISAIRKIRDRDALRFLKKINIQNAVWSHISVMSSLKKG